MSAQRFFLPAAAGATAIGGLLYYNSTKPEKSRVEQRRERGQAKRDAGLSGAGVGQNAVTGLHEKGGPGSGVPTANTDPDRAVKTDAPKEKLPSGGVGGGVGAGGANTRTTVDITAKKPSSGEGAGMFSSGSGSSSDGQSSSNRSYENGGSSDSNSSSATASSASENTVSSQDKASWSQSLQGIFGQGGATAGEKDEIHKKHHDTKIYSNHADTPTKRFPKETVKEPAK